MNRIPAPRSCVRSITGASVYPITGVSGVLSISTITAAGDSITAGADVDSALARSDGYMGSALDVMGESVTPVYYAPDGTWFQTGGFTAQQILDTWIPRVVTAAPDACVIHAGTNSLTSAAAQDADLDVGAAWLFDQLEEMADDLLAAGITPIRCTIIPDNNYSGYGADERTVRQKVNDLLRSSGKGKICDWAGVLSLSPGDDTALGDPDWFQDNLHPNGQGYIELGQFLADFINAEFSVGEEFTIPDESDSAWLTTNPYLTGDSGGLATGWNLAGSASTKSGSKPSSNVQRISTTSAFGTIKSARFQNIVTVTDGSFNGKTVRPVVRVTFPDPTKIPVWIELQMNNDDLDGSVSNQYSYCQRSGGSGNLNAFTRVLGGSEMLMLGPPVDLITTAGSDRNRIYLYVYVYGGDNEGIVDLQTCGVVEV